MKKIAIVAFAMFLSALSLGVSERPAYAAAASAGNTLQSGAAARTAATSIHWHRGWGGGGWHGGWGGPRFYFGGPAYYYGGGYPYYGGYRRCFWRTGYYGNVYRVCRW